MRVRRDQARVVSFPVSDLSAFITGPTVSTDGGIAAAAGRTNRPVNP
jgi:hypothetical protein